MHWLIGKFRSVIWEFEENVGCTWKIETLDNGGINKFFAWYFVLFKWSFIADLLIFFDLIIYTFEKKIIKKITEKHTIEIDLKLYFVDKNDF